VETPKEGIAPIWLETIRYNRKGDAFGDALHEAHFHPPTAEETSFDCHR
jgi:hypothetical protein